MGILSKIQDERIHVFQNEKNSGAGVSRNKALREAKGRWIAFTDSDDLWNSHKLEKMLDFMQKNNYSFAYHNYEKIEEESKSLGVYVTDTNVVTKTKTYNYLGLNLYTNLDLIMCKVCEGENRQIFPFTNGLFHLQSKNHEELGKRVNIMRKAELAMRNY